MIQSTFGHKFFVSIWYKALYKARNASSWFNTCIDSFVLSKIYFLHGEASYEILINRKFKKYRDRLMGKLRQ